MKFNILTLGCKVNSYESDFMKELLVGAGYIEVSLDDNPDVVIVNTCSVTNQSDAKSRHMIRLAKRKAPAAILIACGCSAQNHKEKLLDLGVDILLGNKDKSYILNYIEEFKNRKEPIVKFFDMANQPFETMYLKSETDKTRAFVKIQDGCNNFCSYCIIPYMRGNIRSKDIDLATKEIEDLVNMGHSEIVLTGIHTGSYGRGLGYDLTDLIRRISLFPNLKRIRISSIEITELDDKFLEELKNNPKICNHLHIPLQSGSNLVLLKMNRKYDTEFYRKKIETIRKIRPDISITTDLIIGFPYEGEKEFQETYDFLKEIQFTKIHTFPFSLRSGTKAETMKDYFVDESVKKERVRKVLDLSLELEESYYKKFIGKEVSVIFETSKDAIAKGHTDNYILVHVDNPVPDGESRSVLIDTVDGLYVKGHIV